MAYSIQSLSLCSGVGMLDEGIRLACEYFNWPYRCVGMCERDAYAAGILLARMEESALEPTPIWCGSLEEMDAESMRGYVNLISAGFPCQPHSLAGKRKSTDDERWIWPAIVEVIRKVGPEWVFLENVPGLLSSGDGSGFGEVLRDLAESGFDAEWCCVSAAQVGASHRRERVFILAHDHGQRQLQPSRGEQAKRRRIINSGCDVGHASSERLEGTKPSKRRFRKRAQSSGYNRALGNTECNSQGNRIAGEKQSEKQREGRGEEVGDRGGIFAPGPSDFDGWGRVVEDGAFDFLAPSIKPGFRVLVDGLADFLDCPICNWAGYVREWRRRMKNEIIKICGPQEGTTQQASRPEMRNVRHGSQGNSGAPPEHRREASVGDLCLHEMPPRFGRDDGLSAKESSGVVPELQCPNCGESEENKVLLAQMCDSVQGEEVCKYERGDQDDMLGVQQENTGEDQTGEKILHPKLRYHLSKFAIDLSRPDQLRCGGNGVVPSQAALSFVLLVKRFYL